MASSEHRSPEASLHKAVKYYTVKYMRRLVAGVAVAGALLVSGCGESGPEFDPNASATATTSASPPHPEAAAAAALLPLMEELPFSLPLGVSFALRHAVSVEAAQTTPSHERENFWWFSGVNLGNGQILTAGHPFYYEGNERVPNINHCGNITVDMAAPGVEGSIDDTEKLTGATYVAERAVGTFDKLAEEGAKLPDWSILQLTPGVIEPTEEPLRIRKTPIGRNEPLYFIGYPSEGQLRRTPNESRLAHLDSELAERLDEPIIYGGVTATEPDLRYGKIWARTSYRSFGAFDHPFGVSGDSGELAVDSNGELVGITVEASPQESTARSVLYHYGVNLANVEDLQVAASCNP